MGEILRHKKTGGLYEVLFRGAVIHSDVPLSDDAPITVCRRLPDGQIVARFGPTPRGNFDVLHHSRLQTDVLLHDGAEVVVYRALNGWLVWVRPTAEMGDGRFEPADAPQPPSSTPGEAERLVDRLIAAVEQRSRVLRGIVTRVSFTEAEEAFQAARTALLSHISTAGRGEGAAYEELDAVSARVQQGWDADESVFDAARLRWLEAQARKSRTGISFDWVPPVEGERSGFRFMRRFFITEQCDTLKAAIDRAMLEDPEHPSDRKIDPEAESARLVAAITGEAPGPLLAEIAEGRAAHRRSLAARLQHRLDAMAERGMESVGISKGFAAELVHALSADATNPQDQEREMTSETRTPPLSIGFDIAIELHDRLRDQFVMPPEARVWLAGRITGAVNAARLSSPTPDGVIKERGEDGRRPDGPGLSHSVSSPSAAEIERLADDYVLRVSEWDDRTSPEDWPEALLITRGELKCELIGFVRELYEAPASTVQPPSSQDSGVGEAEGWVLVPREPTEAMWGGLARQIVMWTRCSCPTGHALHRDLKNCGWEVPAWLADEIPDEDRVPPKGSVAVAIYRAMIEAAPRPSQREG